MRVVRVRSRHFNSRHFNSRQPNGLNLSDSLRGVSLLRGEGGGGGGGAFVRDKNTSAGPWAKNAGGGGGLCVRGAYLRDTTVYTYTKG